MPDLDLHSMFATDRPSRAAAKVANAKITAKDKEAHPGGSTSQPTSPRPPAETRTPAKVSRGFGLLHVTFQPPPHVHRRR